MAYAASPLPAEGPSDAESLRNLALVLLGIAVGFWVFVAIRMMAEIVEVGASSRLLIETIDRTAVETVAAALISVLAVASAVASRMAAGRGASTGLVWGAGALATGTVVAAIWRLI
jgi:threonine dehydrogenase-like Zn-dependent dehydrogenase